MVGSYEKRFPGLQFRRANEFKLLVIPGVKKYIGITEGGAFESIGMNTVETCPFVIRALEAALRGDVDGVKRMLARDIPLPQARYRLKNEDTKIYDLKIESRPPAEVLRNNPAWSLVAPNTSGRKRAR